MPSLYTPFQCFVKSKPMLLSLQPANCKNLALRSFLVPHRLLMVSRFLKTNSHNKIPVFKYLLCVLYTSYPRNSESNEQNFDPSTSENQFIFSTNGRLEALATFVSFLYKLTTPTNAIAGPRSMKPGASPSPRLCMFRLRGPHDWSSSLA